jgi:hypothetical protein
VDGTGTHWTVVNTSNQVNVTGFQPASAALTNWSLLPTNVFDTRYDAAGTALAIGLANTNFTLSASNSVMNTASNWLSSSNATYQLGLIQAMPNLGNEYLDMMAYSNAINGTAIGYSIANPYITDLWLARTHGLGSNVWGGVINLPGGVQNLGNPFWFDFPQSQYLSSGVYMGFGPTRSSVTNAFPTGLTNGTYQPGFNVVNANPYSGIGFIDIKSGFTNSIHGQFAGNDLNGTSVYVPQYGFVLGQLSDAYGIRSNGVLDTFGRESQQAPSYNMIFSDTNLDFYISENGFRPGDRVGGQIPLFAIGITNIGNGQLIAGFPLQVSNVYVWGNPAWRWALGVDEMGGTVFTTNAIFQAGTITATNGAGISNLNASLLSSGTVPTARLGSGSASSSTFLRGDQQWATPSGSGNVSGPASSTDGNFAVYNGTTGTVISNSAFSPSSFDTNGAAKAYSTIVSNALLDASALGANSHVKTGATTNLISSEDATGYTNTVSWTHDGTATNLTASFNGTLQSFTVTNGPTVFIGYAGANGSVSYRFTTNVSLIFTYQPKWLSGSNNAITNGVLSLTSYGGTNATQIEAAIGENQ